MPSMKDRLGVKELTTGARVLLLKALFAEFLGTLFLNFFGCASVVHKWSPDGAANIIQIALAFGLAAASIIQCICHVSGGHINPAVTLSMVFTSNITIVRGLLYIIAQCLGAIAGSGILIALTPENVGGNYGTTGPDARLTEPQALGMEFILGFILVLVVFAVCDPVRNLGHHAPLAIGFVILLGHLAAIPYTGSSMNPARSFGSAVVVSHWDHHWVYWLGPSLGGICAGLIYKHVFAMQPEHKEESEYRPVRAEEKEASIP
ncbi:aquaporin AQPAe.a-like isoform X2 [Ischnura elegans]|uniref:aquaporin AQPAe.a-like isoform X2 n=1 Tax=Ischnura elegans TaxID=197161 RepID=UPI001ED8B13A|nr:aquaporin AQPAe.a-like isoform X2 [Ischnura elegans]